MGNLIVTLVEASDSLKNKQMERVNEICLKNNISLEYIKSEELEILKCDENCLTFVWCSSFDKLIKNFEEMNQQVINLN